MAYDLKLFSELRVLLIEKLMDSDGEPLSCGLYDSLNATAVLTVPHEDGFVVEHVAEACNIASQIQSIDRLLSLPRSSKGCSELSELLIVSFDILRECIRAATPSQRYSETEADRTVRAWGGFIKHPKDYVFAHRCFADVSDPLQIINSQFLRNWDCLANHQKDLKKAELAHSCVVAELPSLRELSDYFDSCAGHLNNLIGYKLMPD